MNKTVLFLVLFAFCWGDGEKRTYDSVQKLSNPYESDIMDFCDDGFVFFTDTHAKSNKLNSTAIIESILKNTRINRVIWGGDAITAHGPLEDLDSEWNAQSRAFKSIMSYGDLYLVRGNHDLMKKNPKNKSSIILPQEEVRRLFMDNMSGNIIMNPDDSLGLYYYFDDEKNKIRYIIIESYFTGKEKNGSNKIIAGATSKQLSWIAKEAVMKTPSGYGIVFAMHAPVMTMSNKSTFREVYIAKMIEAVSAKKRTSIDGELYDFTQMKDVDVLMVVAGHRHHDMQTFLYGTLHVISASDAQYRDYCRDPFVQQCTNRKGENEQCVDVFSFDRENKMIYAKRYGLGGNRDFHLTPVIIAVGDTISLQAKMSPIQNWTSYNAEDNLYIKSTWTLNNDIVSVSKDGVVSGLQSGSAVVFSQDDRGNREFYNVVVK